jgi:ribosome-associated protein
MATIDMDLLLREVRFTYARSSGPGGQNVNKVSSKAVMHWDLEASGAISLDVKERFRSKYARRVSNEGIVTLSSDQYRDQKRNVEACIETLTKLLTAVLSPPVVRKPKPVPRAQKEQRLRQKKLTSLRKASRRSRIDE